MKFRMFLTVVVILVTYFSIQHINHVVSPKTQDDLAVQQFKDPGAAANMRKVQDMQNGLGVVALLISGSLLFLIWKKPAVKAYKNIIGNTESCNTESKTCSGCNCNTESDKQNS